MKCHSVLTGFHSSLAPDTPEPPPFSSLSAHCACAALSHAHAAPLSWRRRSGVEADSGRDGAVKWVTTETSLQQFPQVPGGLSSLWTDPWEPMSDVPCLIFCSFCVLFLSVRLPARNLFSTAVSCLIFANTSMTLLFRYLSFIRLAEIDKYCVSYLGSPQRDFVLLWTSL